MSEEDIKDAAVDATEEETSEYDNLADFVDLEDLSDLMGEDDFADLNDLGDISDLDLDGDDKEDKADNLPSETEVAPEKPEKAEESNDTQETSLDELVGGFLDNLDAAGGVADHGGNAAEGDSTATDHGDNAAADRDNNTVEGNSAAADHDSNAAEGDSVAADHDSNAAESNVVADHGNAAMEEPAEEDEASLLDSIPDDLETLLASGSFDTEKTAEISDAPEKAGANTTDATVEPEQTDTLMDSLVEPEQTGTPVDALVEPEQSEDAMDALVEPEVDETEPDISEEFPDIDKQDPEPEEETFGLDDILALDEDGADNPDDDMQALLEGLGGSGIPEESADEQKVTKKPGLLKRLFGNVITDEIAQAELAERAKEQEEEAAKKEAAEAAREEKKAAKAAKTEEKAEAKKAKAEEKELKKAAKAEEKAARKAEREAKKAEEEEEAELEVTGKLNKVGVSIVVILAAMFLAAEISGTKIFSYRSTVKEATSFFEAGRYTDAYQEILGTDMKKSDQETYDKIVTVMKVQRALNSYENYDNMKYYPDALNALLVGLKKYDENLDTAKSLEVEDDLDSCRDKILTLLNEEYGLSESQARELLALDKTAYTDKVVAIAMKKQS